MAEYLIRKYSNVSYVTGNLASEAKHTASGKDRIATESQDKKVRAVRKQL